MLDNHYTDVATSLGLRILTSNRSFIYSLSTPHRYSTIYFDHTHPPVILNKHISQGKSSRLNKILPYLTPPKLTYP